jgi:hypothetical protein
MYLHPLCIITATPPAKAPYANVANIPLLHDDLAALPRCPSPSGDSTYPSLPDEDDEPITNSQHGPIIMEEDLDEKIQTQYPSSASQHVQESQELGLQEASSTTPQAGSPPSTSIPTENLPLRTPDEEP